MSLQKRKVGFYMYSFLILGSDKRQTYLKDYFINSGYNAVLSNKIESGFDYIVLPLPCVEGDYIKGTEILYTLLPKNKKIFAGKAELLKGFENVFDYSESDAFKEKNALPSAEGAIKEAIENFVGVLYKSRCLISGYGKIGKELSGKLKALGADVTVSARKEADFEFAKAENTKIIKTEDIYDLKDFDIIFNTIPFPHFSSKTISTMKNDSIFIELASSPFGVKEEDTKNIKYIKALSLPGKYSPKYASKLIRDSILSNL